MNNFNDNRFFATNELPRLETSLWPSPYFMFDRDSSFTSVELGNV
jgi:hypothetical protein